MKKIIKYVLYSLRAVFFLPHLFLYFFSKEKNIIDEDVEAMLKANNVRIINGIHIGGVIILLNLLVNDKYFRKMFYTRIGILSHLVSWYSPGDNTFFPCREIGGGFYMPHPYATILNAKRIGRNFTCRQCTTVGNKYDGDNINIPVIGDNVTLGANVVIIGGIRIGDNVTIGAGSVVVKDIPENSVVVGNPAKIIKCYSDSNSVSKNK